MWNDYDAGTECFLYARKNLAEEYAVDYIVATYDDLDNVEWQDNRPYPFFARLKDRFEISIHEVELLKA